MLDRFALDLDPKEQGLVLDGNRWIDPTKHLLVGLRSPYSRDPVYHWLTPEERHQLFWEQEASHHFVACARVPMMKVIDVIPRDWIEPDEINKIAGRLFACCRAVRSHDIEAFFTCVADRDRGVPDLYVTHCKCGRKHRRPMLGGSIGSGVPFTEPRPMWTLKPFKMGMRVGVNR